MRFTRPSFRCITLLAAAFALTGAISADVSCPPVFGDHMVLQRDKPVAVWGTADAGESIAVEFDDHSTTTAAAADGRWAVHLDPLAASATPRTLTVRGRNTLTYSDVLVGDVWLCSGQSNMEKPLGPRKGQRPTDDSEAEIASAEHPLLRLYQVPQGGRPTEKIASLRWVACTPETIVGTQFSAAGYFFGREIQRELGVPVGLIHASYGGTMIEAWMPPEAFASSPKLAPLRDRRYFAWVEGVQATELHQSMIAPLVPFTLRGFLWYQGEANCMDADDAIYAAKLGALITSWRTLFRDETAPFYFAQLAPFNYSAWEKFQKWLTPEALPLFWESQARALAVPNTALVVTTDLAGDARDIHPTNKRDVGLRFARLALWRTYGREPDFPGFAQFVSSESLDGGRIRVRLKNTGGSLHSRDGQPLTHFAVAGRDKAFKPAHAAIDGDTIIVSSPEVPAPLAVRFGWHETANPNLVNAAGLPVVPFRTDSWRVQIERPKVDTAAPAPSS
ncbi:MAG: sialate O-acetylesterase [Opitutaceae bacterium]|nr:sialate O-acetylesterase [Opitutaceae bacterium]